MKQSKILDKDLNKKVDSFNLKKVTTRNLDLDFYIIDKSTIQSIDFETKEKLISKIVRELEGMGENEVSSSVIGEMVMQGLYKLDKVAFVRFASVYRDFREAKDFEQFLGSIDKN